MLEAKDLSRLAGGLSTPEDTTSFVGDSPADRAQPNGSEPSSPDQSTAGEDKLEREIGARVSGDTRDESHEQREQRAEVQKGLTGNFMDGWMNLKDWRAARKIEP